MTTLEALLTRAWVAYWRAVPPNWPACRAAHFLKHRVGIVQGPSGGEWTDHRIVLRP